MDLRLPKLSYVLLSHNRAPFLRKAIESAFAQQYEGELEFILSDDCSTDASYAIMQDCAAAYKGPHRVVVTQTPTNLHLAGHTNHALHFATADWIVRADDDDFSRIDRCQRIGEALAPHPQCRYLVHGLQHFHSAGEKEAWAASQQAGAAKTVQARVLDPRKGYKVVGSYKPSRFSYNVWHRDVYRVFGDLQIDAYYVDDLCSYFRANVLGYGLCLDDEPLHFIRQGCQNMCRGGADESRGYKSIINLENFHDRYYSMTMVPLLMDVESFQHFTQGDVDMQDYMMDLHAEMQRRRDMATFWKLGILNRLQITYKYDKLSLFSLLRCLPLPLFASLQAAYRQFFSR